MDAVRAAPSVTRLQLDALCAALRVIACSGDFSNLQLPGCANNSQDDAGGAARDRDRFWGAIGGLDYGVP